MLSYIMIGANDLELSGRVYSAILLPLGYERKVSKTSLIYTPPQNPDQNGAAGVPIYITKPYDGRAATIGNGSMTAFRVESHMLVRALYAAALKAGGTDDGAPGFRAEYSEHFFVSYLRDPVGNKLAIYCKNPNEPSRSSMAGSL